MRRVVEIALFTDHPDQLVLFYQELLAALPTQRWDGGATFDVGGITLLIHERSASDPHGPANRDHVAIGVEDVNRAADLLRGQGIEVDGPNDYYWGRSAYLEDPDGRMVELHHPPE